MTPRERAMMRKSGERRRRRREKEKRDYWNAVSRSLMFRKKQRQLAIAEEKRVERKVWREKRIEEVKKIRKMRDEGFIYAEIGERFAMSAANVCNICNRKIWKYVD